MRNWSTTQLTDAYKRQGSPCPVQDACGEGKRHKFNVGPKEERTVDGIVFDSKREAFHYRSLKIAEQVGAITGLELQPRLRLQEPFEDRDGKHRRAVDYVGDFGFKKDGQYTVVDTKGFETAAFKIKWKLVIAKFPEIKFEVWR